ncbi:hypothetical protein AB1Y20_005235 [Prymnesium parvum]|uniref:Acid phosphatase n=1 Tax=Prymnesium parvum TaxID=97485 RepID=A0AB34J5K9_PRYPA
MESSSSSTRDVFVFRHCVRSVDYKKSFASLVLPAYALESDYTNASLPQWGVPPEWCTPEGLRLLEGSGAQLASLLAHGVEWVSDTVARDGASALAMVRGAGREPAAVTYAPRLFDTLDPDMGGAPLCEAEFTPAEVRQAVRQRLQSIPMPAALAHAEALLTGLIGTGRAGPLSDIPPTTVNAVGKLTGSVAILKQFAQNLFYAFASGVTYHTLRPPSADEYFQLLAWQHWVRSVQSIDNPKTATENAALLHAVLSRLQAPGGGASVFLGHDGNLDGLASLLELQWEAPPYRSGQLYPTPPGSGLHFSRKESGVTISFLYPTPISSGVHGAAMRNESGLLQRSHIADTTLEELIATSERQLHRFPGAWECYTRASDQWPSRATTASLNSNVVLATIIGISVVGSFLLHIYIFRRSRQRHAPTWDRGHDSIPHKLP